jgi:hypothetical protein
MDKQRLKLIDTAWCHENEVEYRVQSLCKTGIRVADHPEGKASKQGIGDVETYFVPDVVRISPQRYDLTSSDEQDLIPDRSGEAVGLISGIVIEITLSFCLIE